MIKNTSKTHNNNTTQQQNVLPILEVKSKVSVQLLQNVNVLILFTNEN